MNYYRFPENRITKLALGLYLFLQLYLCRDSMFCLSVVGFYPAQAISLALTGVLGLVFLWYQRRNLKAILTDGRVAVALAATAVMLVPMVVKADWQFMYLSILSYMYTAILLSFFLSWREVAKYYVLILCGVGAYSVLAAYVLRVPIDRGWVEPIAFLNGAGHTFYNFFLSTVPEIYVKFRNFGMFREPGVYQYFILLAQYLGLFAVEWKKEAHMWIAEGILCIVMLTTFATGGLLELGLLGLYVIFKYKLYKNKYFIAVVLIAIVLVSILLTYWYFVRTYMIYELYLMTIGKFVQREDSFTERSDAIVQNVQMMLKHPLVGGKLAEVLHAVENNTCSSLILLAGLGLISGSVHILAWVAMVWDKNRKVLENLFLLGLFFLSFNTQNLSWDLYFWLIPGMALTQRAVPAIQAWRGRKHP